MWRAILGPPMRGVPPDTKAVLLADELLTHAYERIPAGVRSSVWARLLRSSSVRRKQPWADWRSPTAPATTELTDRGLSIRGRRAVAEQFQPGQIAGAEVVDGAVRGPVHQLVLVLGVADYFLTVRARVPVMPAIRGAWLNELREDIVNATLVAILQNKGVALEARAAAAGRRGWESIQIAAKAVAVLQG